VGGLSKLKSKYNLPNHRRKTSVVIHPQRSALDDSKARQNRPAIFSRRSIFWSSNLSYRHVYHPSAPLSSFKKYSKTRYSILMTAVYYFFYPKTFNWSRPIYLILHETYLSQNIAEADFFQRTYSTISNKRNLSFFITNLKWDGEKLSTPGNSILILPLRIKKKFAPKALVVDWTVLGFENRL